MIPKIKGRRNVYISGVVFLEKVKGKTLLNYIKDSNSRSKFSIAFTHVPPPMPKIMFSSNKSILTERKSGRVIVIDHTKLSLCFDSFHRSVRVLVDSTP